MDFLVVLLIVALVVGGMLLLFYTIDAYIDGQVDREFEHLLIPEGDYRKGYGKWAYDLGWNSKDRGEPKRLAREALVRERVQERLTQVEQDIKKF